MTSPKKIALVAGREFMAAVTNKGFLIGLLIMPAVFAVIFALMPRLMATQLHADQRRRCRHRFHRPGRAGAARGDCARRHSRPAATRDRPGGERGGRPRE